MSAKIAEALANIAQLHAQLGEAYTEYSALVDAASAKSGKSGDDGAAGTVSGKGGKAGVAPKKGGGKKAAEVTKEELTAKAKEVAAKHGKEKVAEILGGKVADVDEDDYAEKFAELEAALEEEEEGELPDPKSAAGKAKKGGKAAKVTEDDLKKLAKQVIEKHGKDCVVEILGGKLADVDEDDYAEKLAELQTKLDEEVEEEV